MNNEPNNLKEVRDALKNSESASPEYMTTTENQPPITTKFDYRVQNCYTKDRDDPRCVRCPNRTGTVDFKIVQDCEHALYPKMGDLNE